MALTRRRFASFVLVAVVLTALGVALSRRTIVESLIRGAVEEAGFSIEAVTVVEVGTDQLILRSVAVADGAISADQIRVDYTVSELREGRVNFVVIDGLRIDITKLALAVPDSNNTATLDAAKLAEMLIEPLRRIGSVRLRTSTLRGLLPTGQPVEFGLAGTLKHEAQGAWIDVELTASPRMGALKAEIVTAVYPTGELLGLISLQSKRLIFDDTFVDGIFGLVNFQLFGDTPAAIRGELQAKSLTTPGVPPLACVRATAEWSDSAGRMTASVEGGDISSDVTVVLREVGGSLATSVAARIQTAASHLNSLISEPVFGAGAVAVELESTGSLPGFARLRELGAEELSCLVSSPWAGRLDLTLDHVDLLEHAESISTTVAVGFVTTPESVDLEMLEDARVTIDRLDRAWLDSLGIPPVSTRADELVVALSPVQIALELGGAPAEPLEVTRAVIRNVDLKVENLEIAESRVSSVRIAGDFIYDSALRGDFEIEVEAPLLTADGLRVEDVTIAAELRLGQDETKTTITSRHRASFAASSASLVDGPSVVEPFKFKAWDMTFVRTCIDDACTMTHEGKIDSPHIIIVNDDPPARGDLGNFTVSWTGATGEQPELYGTIAASGARLDALDEKLELVNARVRFDVHPAEDGVLAKLEFGRVQQLGPEPLVQPFSATGSIREGGVGFDLVATVKVGRAEGIAVTGNYQSDSDTLWLEIDTGELSLHPKRLKAVEISPALSKLADVTGKAHLKARIDRVGDELTSRATLTLADFGASVDDITFEGLETELNLDDLFPPKGPAHQSFTIEKIVTGYGSILDDLTGSYQVVPGEKLRIKFDNFEGKVAGGRLKTGDLTMSEAGLDSDMILRLEEIDLQELFKLTQLEQLTGTGLLTGQLPISVTKSQIVITGGKLEAVGPGVLRYQSDDASSLLQGNGEWVDMVVNALKNFHYEKMAIHLDTTADNELSLRLELEGSNPDVLDGYPLRLNVNFGSRIGSLLDALDKANKVKRDILKRSTER